MSSAASTCSCRASTPTAPLGLTVGTGPFHLWPRCKAQWCNYCLFLPSARSRVPPSSCPVSPASPVHLSPVSFVLLVSVWVSLIMSNVTCVSGWF